MNWITIIWSMIASACLTLAMIHFVTWCYGSGRTAWASLAFAVTALAVAGMAAAEFMIMRARTPEQIGTAMRWANVPVLVIIVGLIWFVRLSFGTGRAWLGWLAVGMRCMALILNFTSGTSVIHRQVTRVAQIELLGERVSVVAEAVPNPWVLVPELGNLVMVLFVADASVRLWRRGGQENRRRALQVGGSFVGFMVMAAGFGALVNHQVVRAPYLVGFTFLVIVLVMNFELSRDVHRAARLSQSLRESEEHFRLVVEASPTGIILVNRQSRIVLVNALTEVLFGYSRAELIGQSIEVLMPQGSRGAHSDLVSGYFASPEVRAMGAGRELFARRKDGTEFPVEIGLSPIRSSQGTLVLTAITDITARRKSSAALRDLSRRLISAHEEERARLARELHDDVTQRLARMAIDAGRLERGDADVSAAETIRSICQGLVRLSEDIHALSYRLHPSVLEDLGLAEALKAECERFARQESIPTDVHLHDLPAVVPKETALCLFRVSQEALRNVARHARARTVDISVTSVGGSLQLAVLDDGVGFDPALQNEHPSLGMASMRERVLLLGGELDVESKPGQGTTILASVPLTGKRP
jgi:PAS domain S-box-containing protein